MNQAMKPDLIMANTKKNMADNKWSSFVRRQDGVIVNKNKRISQMLPYRLKLKESEKLDKCMNLAREVN